MVAPRRDPDVLGVRVVSVAESDVGEPGLVAEERFDAVPDVDCRSIRSVRAARRSRENSAERASDVSPLAAVAVIIVNVPNGLTIRVQRTRLTRSGVWIGEKHLGFFPHASPDLGSGDPTSAEIRAPIENCEPFVARPARALDRNPIGSGASFRDIDALVEPAGADSTRISGHGDVD